MNTYVLDTILCVFELLILKTITTEEEIVFFFFFQSLLHTILLLIYGLDIERPKKLSYNN
jgi:hypothetical protein